MSCQGGGRVTRLYRACRKIHGQLAFVDDVGVQKENEWLVTALEVEVWYAHPESNEISRHKDHQEP